MARTLPALLVLTALAGLFCHVCHVAFTMAPAQGLMRAGGQTRAGGLTHHRAGGLGPHGTKPSSGMTSGLVVGFAGSLGVMAAVFAHSGRQHSRVAARVAPGAPSLIQVLEQKKLLSTVEKTGLLAQAEVAGLSIDTVEKLGLLKLAEDLKLLSTAETLATSPSTPVLLALGSGALAAATYYDVTMGSSLGFFQWVIAGALGAPALVLAVAGLAVIFITGGTRRTQDLDLDDTIVTYTTARGSNGTFRTEKKRVSFTLLDVLEKKKLLSYLEENQLLSLAASVVQRPLTLTQQLGVLSQLEKFGLLSTVEASATDSFGPGQKFGFAGLSLALAAVAVATSNFFLGALITLPALVLIAVGIAFGIVQAPLGGA